jgi:Adenylate and Guanylate cyclase catalytic domain
MNLLPNPYFKELPQVVEQGTAVLGTFLYDHPGNTSTSLLYAGFLSNDAQEEVYYDGDPMSHIYMPIFKSFNETDREVVAVIFAVFQWAAHFKNVLHERYNGIILVLENKCDGPVTYEINGKDVKFIGKGDSHDVRLDDMERRASFENFRTLQDGSASGISFQHDYCTVSIRIYPSQNFIESQRSSMPLYMTLVVLFVFLFTSILFLFYDRLVERRQNLVVERFLRSTAIVSSLFPQNIVDRLLHNSTSADFSNKNSRLNSNNRQIKSFLLGGNGAFGDKPVADLFPFSTVLFADIAEFTAWSSTRDPSQVFLLLQNLYQAFDILAKKRNVFKVETIGDCYVAVTGVPEPQEQHAVVMARFVFDCQVSVINVTERLGRILGPGTINLRMRFGINSGPVTAGIIVGERARFQLFGDTVNIAARMERYVSFYLTE